MFKFVGDNVDKTKGVRDIRSDHRAELKHMYSLLAVKYRVIAPPTCGQFVCLESIPIANFLPTKADVVALKSNLVELVSRILVKYIKPLSKLSRVVSHHIPHTHSAEMKLKSETTILDVMHKNEAKSSDLLDIMKAMQMYLGQEFRGTVLSGGDQMTCERQRGSQRHMMDADTREDRLELLEPQLEDWHALQCLLGVSPY